jgi:hypothetical protein
MNCDISDDELLHSYARFSHFHPKAEKILTFDICLYFRQIIRERNNCATFAFLAWTLLTELSTDSVDQSPEAGSDCSRRLGQNYRHRDGGGIWGRDHGAGVGQAARLQQEQKENTIMVILRTAFVIALLMALGGVLSACGFSNTFNYGHGQGACENCSDEQ